MATSWEKAAHSAYDMLSKYYYLIVSLVFPTSAFFLIAPFPDHCLLVRFNNFTNQLELADTDVTRVNTAKKGQRVNSNWQKVRKLITLTASDFGSICKRRNSTPTDNLIKLIASFDTSH